MGETSVCKRDLLKILDHVTRWTRSLDKDDLILHLEAASAKARELEAPGCENLHRLSVEWLEATKAFLEEAL